jgi:CRISPR-associated endonuclease/helicase Cas3
LSGILLTHQLDRFGINKEVNVYCIAVPELIHQGKGTGSAARFLSRMFTFGATKAWYQMLQSHLDGKSISLLQLYNLYENFHHSDNAKKHIETDLIGSLKASVKLINQKVIDPITIPSKKAPLKGHVKISKNSLRGDNRFVQMALCNVNDHNQPKFLDQYAYKMPVNAREGFDNLTASKDEIEGYGDSDKNLLAYMKSKHHNIMGGIKAYKDFILMNEARDPEFPIYLSYTSSDLMCQQYSGQKF